MKTVNIIVCLLALATQLQLTAQVQKFGAAINSASLPQKSTTIKNILTSQPAVNDITIVGEVKSVCSVKGCWMKLDAGNGQEVMVKFKDYAFFMPKDCAGKTVTCTGKAYKQIVSIEEQKHLAEDAGKSKKEIRKIKTPKEEYRFEASGVELNG